MCPYVTAFIDMFPSVTGGRAVLGRLQGGETQRHQPALRRSAPGEDAGAGAGGSGGGGGAGGAGGAGAGAPGVGAVGAAPTDRLFDDRRQTVIGLFVGAGSSNTEAFAFGAGASPATAAAAEVVTHCPRGHRLLPFEAPDKGFGCDGGGRYRDGGCSLSDLPQGYALLSCHVEGCNFDLCAACAAGAAAQEQRFAPTANSTAEQQSFSGIGLELALDSTVGPALPRSGRDLAGSPPPSSGSGSAGAAAGLRLQLRDVDVSALLSRVTLTATHRLTRVTNLLDLHR